MRKFVFLLMASALCASLAGCESKTAITRENFSDTLTEMCRQKFQARVVCKPVGNTIWVYLPYTPSRQGNATITEKPEGAKYNLDIDYDISSFNPYRAMQPAELTHVVQGVLFQIRQLLLRCTDPFTFFVLVNCNIQDPANQYEEWDIGYIKDVQHFDVGKKYSGEAYNRLTWHSEPLVMPKSEDSNEGVSPSYRDLMGEHVQYRDMTMRDFLEKQIKWRIYKRFTIDYNSVPFDLTAEEKENEVKKIVSTVLSAYDSDEFVTINVKDVSFLDEHKVSLGNSAQDLKANPPKGMIRKPAF